MDGKNRLQSHRQGAKNAKVMRKLGVLPWHCRATASVRLGEKELLVRLSTLDKETTGV
jgi:hypothetical protein